MVEVTALTCIREGATKHVIGSTIPVDEETAARWISQGMAEAVKKERRLSVSAGTNLKAVDGQTGTAEDEERAKVYKALDAQYKKDPLIAEAKAAGVEFAFDATKPVIINAVIDQGKAEVLLK